MTIAVPPSEKTAWPPTPNLAAIWVFAFGMTTLGATAIAFQTYLPGLQPAPTGLASAGPALAGVVLLLAGSTLAAPPLRGIGAWMLVTFWAGWLMAVHLPRLLHAPADITAWVAASEVVTFALTSLSLVIGARMWRNLSVGLMLVLFGGVHLTYPGAIAGLLPETFPMRDVWPWVTGPIQILAGLAIGARIMPRLAAAGVAAMFLAWVAILHAPRLIQAPSEPFEWTFALTALTLAAAVWIAGDASQPRETVRSSIPADLRANPPLPGAISDRGARSRS
jgi:uncharacterized membrane protein